MAREIGRSLHSAGVDPSQIGLMTLRAIRQHLDAEAVATGFRDSCFAIGFCCLLAILPMFVISLRHNKK
jgi:hypothetical protein